MHRRIFHIILLCTGLLSLACKEAANDKAYKPDPFAPNAAYDPQNMHGLYCASVQYFKSASARPRHYNLSVKLVRGTVMAVELPNGLIINEQDFQPVLINRDSTAMLYAFDGSAYAIKLWAAKDCKTALQEKANQLGDDMDKAFEKAIAGQDDMDEQIGRGELNRYGKDNIYLAASRVGCKAILLATAPEQYKTATVLNGEVKKGDAFRGKFSKWGAVELVRVTDKKVITVYLSNQKVSKQSGLQYVARECKP